MFLLLVPAAPQVGAALPSTTDPVSQGIVGVVLAGMFVLLTREAAHRVVIAMGAVALLWAITYLTPYHLISFEGMREALDLNVLILLASMMALVGVLKTTGVFERAVDLVMHRAGGRPLVVLALVIAFTAVASAFLDNVTTVVVLAPMSVAMARQMGLPPVALLLPMVAASNIGGTTTLIGDPPNIMIGSGAGLTFIQFLANLTFPCVLMLLWLEYYTRRRFSDALSIRPAARRSEVPGAPPLEDPVLARMLGVICVGVLVGFLTHHLTHMPPAVPALIGAAAALVVQDVRYVRRHRPTAQERMHGVLRVTEEDIEWPTLSFFGLLFIIVGAAVQTGLVGSLADGLRWMIASGSTGLGLSPLGTLLFASLLICWASGLLSALIDNIPFVAVAIPIIARLVPELAGDSLVLWWALSLGACLGGNGTIIGASANVTAVGLAERGGTRVSFREYAAFAAPMTVGTLVIASGYLALHVYLGESGSLVAAASLAALAGLVRLASGRRASRAAAEATP